MPITGYSTDIPGHILDGPGVLYVGNAILGATRGAPSFDKGAEWENIGFDGKRSDIAGLDRVRRYDPVIACTLIEFQTADVGRLEPSSTSSGTGTVIHVPQPAGVLVLENELLDDLRLVFDRMISPNTYVALHFPKALVRRYRIAGQDNDIALIETEFVARVDIAGGDAVNAAPYRIELRDTLPS